VYGDERSTEDGDRDVDSKHDGFAQGRPEGTTAVLYSTWHGTERLAFI
jgi:hypothetical protein